MVDKTYCASSYLMYRTVVDKEKCFSEKLPINRFTLDFPRTPVYTAKDLSISLEKQIKEWTADGKTALALSDGIDSAILAKFMPGGYSIYLPVCGSWC